MNLKDLSGTTILLAILYFTAYGFYRGYSYFFGFPTSFISIGVPELVKYSVAVTGIIFSLIALLHFDTDEKNITFKWGLIFAIFAIALVFGTFYVIGGGGYLFEKNVKQLFGQSLLLGVLGLVGVRALSVFIRNGLKLVSKTHGVMLAGTVLFLPLTIGWAFAYLPYDPLFYSKDNKAFILANYSGNFVLGHCLNESALFSIVDKMEGEVIPVSRQATQEVKTCFLRASSHKNKTP